MKHNKKRNVGIIYELLLQYISQNLVEDNKKNASKALRIIEKRFHKNTELYKEFRLFNALAKTQASNETIALKILNEAKDAVSRYDSSVVDREKSRLIRDINHILEDKNFYHRKVNNYRELGAIQQLLNEWSKGDMSNLKNVLSLEEKVVKILTEQKEEKNMAEVDPNLTDKLVVKLMTEKINKRYSENLNSEQKTIIQNYSLYHTEANQTKMRDYLIDLKNNTIKAMNNYKKEADSEMLHEKLDLVISRVKTLNPDIVNDELITKFMTVSKLKEELLKEGK